MVTKPVRVVIREEALGFLFGYARGAFPKEAIVVLRGRYRNDGVVRVDESVLPLKRIEGHSFSTLDFMGVVDTRTVGLGHSHPSGVIRPSEQDLRGFLGRVMLIVGPPFASERDAAFFNRDGEVVPFQVEWSSADHRFRLE